MKKNVAMLLLCAMLVGSFASCGESETNADDPTSNVTDSTVTDVDSPASDSAEEAETEVELAHNLPERDFGGADYVGLIRVSKLSHFTAEELTGEALNDAVYERNLAVEDEFGVKFGFVDLEDSSATFNNAIGQSVMAQDAAYDFVAPDYWWATEVNGWFVNLKTTEYLDLDKPWWCGGWNDAATLNDMLPGAVGFYTLDMIQNMNMIYFNKNLYDSLGFDSIFELSGLYDTVRSGDWTYELFTSMAKMAALDLNGDGKMTEGDQFGTLSDLQSGRALLWSSGLELCYRDEDGSLVPTLSTEHNYDIFSTVLEFYKDTTTNLYNGASNNIFISGKAMFLMSSIGNANALRDMEDDFGVLPYPKYNESDEEYRNRNFGSSYFAIPITVKDIEMSAIILEAQNFYSYRDVRPTYYNTILKDKLARDAETAEMLDLVIDTCYVDPFFVYGTNLSGVADKPFELIINKSDTYTSTMKALEKVVDKQLTKLAEAIKPQENP